MGPENEVSRLPEGSRYQVILSMEVFFPDDTSMFHDDNSRIPGAKRVVQSPDLNPTDNVWDELEKLCSAL